RVGRLVEQDPTEEQRALEEGQSGRTGGRRSRERVDEVRVDEEGVERCDPDPRRRDVDRDASDRCDLEPTPDRHPSRVLQRVSFTFRARERSVMVTEWRAPTISTRSGAPTAPRSGEPSTASRAVAGTRRMPRW